MQMDFKLGPTDGPVQNIFQTFCNGLDMAGLSFEPLMRAAARSQVEMFTLASKRAQAYIEWPMRLSQCRTPQDLTSEQIRFWQTMAQHYTESSQRVMGVWATVARDASVQRTTKPERDYITFPEPSETEAERPAARSGGERRAA